MREAQKEYNWKLNFGEIAQIWRGGCIIRAAFLQKITEAYARNPDLANLLLDPYFNKIVQEGAGQLAQGDRPRRRMRRARPDLQRRPGLLRRLPLGPPAGQPAPGPARLSSARTPTSASTSRAGSSSTSTGPTRSGRSLPFERTSLCS